MGASEAIEQSIGKRLTELGATLTTAESCVGGLIAHRITNVAGSSTYFLGGVVAYSNEAKVTFLGVPQEALEPHGAVSEAVVRHMAEGARARFSADWAIGVTGIAGPTGAAPGKPVGLVFIAVAGANGIQVVRTQFSGTREEIKAKTAEKALTLLWEQIA